MGCPLRPKKKFLLWEIEQPHEFVVHQLKFYPSQSDWSVTQRCKHCDTRRSSHFVDDEKIVRYFGARPPYNEMYGRVLENWLNEINFA